MGSGCAPRWEPRRDWLGGAWEAKKEAGTLQSRGAWRLGVSWVMQRCAPLITEQLARDAVQRSEVQVGRRCA